jgi:arginine/ornithine transport system substrate-binding protein
MIRKFAAATVLFALFGASAAHAQAPNWEKIRIGVEGNYPPFSKMMPDGKFEGFDIDIALAICAQIKAECTLINQEWDGMMPALNSRKFDMIVASMSITEDRKKVADFSDSYYDIPSTFVGKPGLYKDVSPAALKGKTIIVTRNTPRAKYLAEAYKDSTILQVAKEPEVTLELAAGRGDIGFGSSLAATAAFLKAPDVGMAMRKGEDTLRTKVNAALKTITANGVYKKINDKYFDVNIRGE